MNISKSVILNICFFVIACSSLKAIEQYKIYVQNDTGETINVKLFWLVTSKDEDKWQEVSLAPSQYYIFSQPKQGAFNYATAIDKIEITGSSGKGHEKIDKGDEDRMFKIIKEVHKKFIASKGKKVDVGYKYTVKNLYEKATHHQISERIRQIEAAAQSKPAGTRRFGS